MSSSTSSKTTSSPSEVSGAPFLSRNRFLIMCGTAAVVLLIGVTLWSMGSDGMPRLNDDTVSLARFANSTEYAKLSFERQKLYMKVLEDRDDNGELKKAFEGLKLTETEYRTARQEAWLGEQLKRSEKFAMLPAGFARTKYINDLLDRKAAKKAQEAKSGKNKANDEADEVKRDSTLEKLRISAWPEEERMRWQEFRKAYTELKEAREKPSRPATQSANP